jgi:hypothetical protein
MSSHREAPAISKDPVADNTDLYAFVSPDDDSKVTILANYIPLEEPAGGPNFFLFGDDVLYEIKIDHDGDSKEEIVYQFRFKTEIGNPETFLYNTGPIDSLTSSAWNVRQVFSVTRLRKRSPRKKVLGEGLISPPANIGPRSTPDYAALANAAVHDLGGGIRVFAGQREDAFNVDLGSIFDLGALRPFQNLHLLPLPAAAGKDGTKGYNVHTIALQVPKSELTRDGGTPTDPLAPSSVVGIWATASRRQATVRKDEDDDDDDDEDHRDAGPWVQVSRLGNPLINEAVIPLGRKDVWNRLPPVKDSRFLPYFEHPELQLLLPVLYPGVFPNLATNPARPDLVAVLLTGIPEGIVPGFQNFTGSTPADMLRLNLAIPPAGSPNEFGLLGGDPAGFPNGRRVTDNVVAIELRAIAGVTLPLVDPSYTPDDAAGVLTDGTANDVSPLGGFPYLGHPHPGFEHFHD